MTRFFKVSGSGNDFLALAEPAETPTAEQIRAWCHRGVSLGADGLFVIRREDAGGDAVGMDYYNSDGLPADLCLNGTRCAAQLAFHLGWLRAGDTAGTVRTAAGRVAVRRLDPFRVALEVPAPSPPRETPLEVGGQIHTGWFALVGVPHFVLPWPEELDQVPVRELGRALRFHPGLGAPGANVNFVRFPAQHRLEIRTYERGVEDETLSCGTGVLAGAAVAVALGKGTLPLSVLTQSGFELEVGKAEGEGSETWTLTGDARIVASGDLLPGAGRAPSPPHWAVP